jgi:hypothetical protein
MLAFARSIDWLRLIRVVLQYVAPPTELQRQVTPTDGAMGRRCVRLSRQNELAVRSRPNIEG